MKLKNRFCTSIESFIAIIETQEVDRLKRGEHETCILAANLLRRAMRRKLPSNLWVGVEISIRVNQINRKSGSIDLMLLGEDKNGSIRVFIIEFKQWSKVKSFGGSEYETQKWGSEKIKFNLKILDAENPMHQTTMYHEGVETFWKLSSNQISSALVLPNLSKTHGDGFIEECEKMRNKTQLGGFAFEGLDNLIDHLTNHFHNGISPSNEKIILANLGRNLFTMNNTKITKEDYKKQFTPFTPSKSWPTPLAQTRGHGWIGSAEQFIDACERNTIIKDLNYKPGISESRAILFSSNHLAFALRRLNSNNSTLFKQLGVIIEFRLGFDGKRIDAVLVWNSNTEDEFRLLAIEMKAWNEMTQFIPQPQNLGSDLLPSMFSLTVNRKEILSDHPVYQVLKYIEDLQNEFGECVHGVAWLHNVQRRLPKPLEVLIRVEHATYGNSQTKQPIFRPTELSKPISLFTRELQYTNYTSPDTKNIETYIEGIYDSNKGSVMTEGTLKELCGPPKLSDFAVTQAFDNSNYVMREVFDSNQKKLAENIIEKALEAIKTRNKGATPTKTIFCIQGDAGTGKTFIALAAIGKVLNEMQIPGGAGLSNPPHLISFSTAASDMLSKRCMLKKEGYKLGNHFIVSRQNFNSNSRFFLSELMLKRFEKHSPPPLLFFDEAQLQAPTSYSHQNKLYPRDNKTNRSKKQEKEFEQWALKKGLRAKKNGRILKIWKTDVKALSQLADVTVFFIDPKQSTRAISHNNITNESLEQVAGKKGAEFITKELKNAYRSEPAYQELLKRVLYGQNLSYWQRFAGFLQRLTHKRRKERFRCCIETNVDEFIRKFDVQKRNSNSCGLLAGYTMEWKSRDGKTATNHDWDFGGKKMHWNDMGARTWIISKQEREQQVGYFLAVQGNEIDHAYVHIGADLIGKKDVAGFFSSEVIVAEHQEDSECVNDTDDDSVKQECILNQYWVLLTRAKKSCTVYCEDPTLGEYFIAEAKKAGYMR